jgi:hypothetical protein
MPLFTQALACQTPSAPRSAARTSPRLSASFSSSNAARAARSSPAGTPPA